MAAAVTNPIKVTWGTFECGGTTERLIPGLHSISSTFEAFSITFDVLIRGTTDATFEANCEEMEAEFSKRRQAIVVEINSRTVQTFNPADGTNTGLNSYARIDKPGTPGADTDRSRLYTVTLGCEKPATDTSGRRDSTVTVEFEASRRRTVTIAGVWTAVTTNNATAQYLAQIEAYCTSALGALTPSATFERVASPVGEWTERDDQDKVIRFRRVFREILSNQSSGTLDNTSIVDPTVAWSRAIQAPGDSGGGGVKRMEDVSVHFECAVDKTVTTNIASLYSDTVLPFLKADLASRYAPSDFGIVAETYGLIPYTNHLVCDVVFRCVPQNATDVFESVCSSRIVEASGTVLTGAWTGALFAKYADQGIGTKRRFGIRAIRALGTFGPKSRVGGGAAPLFGVGFDGGGSRQGVFGNAPGSVFDSTVGNADNPQTGTIVESDSDPFGSGGSGVGQSASGWILMENDSTATPRWIGQAGGDQIAVTDLVEQTVEEWVVRPSAGGGAGLQPGPGGGVGGITR